MPCPENMDMACAAGESGEVMPYEVCTSTSATSAATRGLGYVLVLAMDG
jgi:hypothetical protein